MSDGLVWLASYPKCGNTWLRSFLTAYLEPEARFELEQLDASIISLRATLDEALGIPTAELTAAEVRELMPQALRALARSPGPRYMKTHDAFGYARNGEPLFPPEATRCVIHLVRDPRDVLVSLHHHRGASLQETLARLNDPEEWTAQGRGEAGPQAPQFLSDWSSHARSWLDAPLPRLTLRYEDMLAAPADCFRQVLGFCGLQVDDRHLAAAVSATSFDRLKGQEAAKGFRERRSTSTAPFFREGRSGGWRDVLSDAQAEAVVQAHGEMMNRLGYAP